MTSVKMEKGFCIALYTLLVASCLQLFAISWAKPQPATEEEAVNETDCNCMVQTWRWWWMDNFYTNGWNLILITASDICLNQQDI